MRTPCSKLLLFMALLSGLTRQASAQSAAKLEFITPPERTVTSEPLRELTSPTPCTVVIDLAVDRNGHVGRSVVNNAQSTCADTALLTKAASHARAYSFAPLGEGPDVQPVRLTWTMEPLRIEEREHIAMDNVGVPDPPTRVETEEVYTGEAVEEMPSFPGGEEAMYRYLRNTVRYPEMERDSGIQGKVYVRFVVERDGRIQQVEVARGVSPGLDRVAMNAVRNMPNWKPGKVAGKVVRVQYILPVSFTLK